MKTSEEQKFSSFLNSYGTTNAAIPSAPATWYNWNELQLKRKLNIIGSNKPVSIFLDV